MTVKAVLPARAGWLDCSGMLTQTIWQTLNMPIRGETNYSGAASWSLSPLGPESSHCDCAVGLGCKLGWLDSSWLLLKVSIIGVVVLWEDCIDIPTHGLWTPIEESPSLHGQKSTPTPKFLGTTKAYFVWDIGPNFQIYAFIRCPCSHRSVVINVSKFQNEVTKSFFLFIFWEKRWLQRFILNFTDL